MEVGDLDKAKTVECRVEILERHGSSMNVNPPSIHRQRVDAGESYSGDGFPNALRQRLCRRQTGLRK